MLCPVNDLRLEAALGLVLQSLDVEVLQLKTARTGPEEDRARSRLDCPPRKILQRRMKSKSPVSSRDGCAATHIVKVLDGFSRPLGQLRVGNGGVIRYCSYVLLLLKPGITQGL